MEFPGGSDGTELACNAEDPSSISGSDIVTQCQCIEQYTGESDGNPLQ